MKINDGYNIELFLKEDHLDKHRLNPYYISRRSTKHEADMQVGSQQLIYFFSPFPIHSTYF